ncbi:porin [Paucibacter sp. R3-3]|uniref:Porin n=1 Tax=Roseateles agri TaxID=3098619 RepID=A0ABU5DSN0_9BURK|nr:porin [Paucibacter sp. R3-3]MDY0748092.1 porin [Paucibacter sp. R3-3]
MKKRFALIPLALVAAQAATAADSGVTVFGVMDNNVTYEKAGDRHMTTVGSSGNVFSRLGFRGTEDLGDGMSAGFWLEMGLFSDSGTLLTTSTNNQGAPAAGTFSRRATVSLEGSFGEIRLGRDHTPTFWSTALFDPFGTGGGIGANHLYFDSLVNGFKPTGTRASNSVGYFLPRNLGGVYGQLMFAVGELGAGTANAHDGDYSGARIGWTDGKFNGALAYGVTKYASGDYMQANLGLSYVFDASLNSLKLMSEIYSDSIGAPAAGGTTQRGHGALIGFQLPVGFGTVKGAYALYKTNAVNDPSSSRVSLGYVYNLSKRSSVYATAAHVSNRHGSTASLGGITDPLAGATSGVQTGITHVF